MMSREMYQANVLDHWKNPRNKGMLAKPDIKHAGQNPLCGDDIEVYMKISNGTVSDVKFKGSGCAISQAAASLLTEHIKGKTLEDVKMIDRDDIVRLLGIPVSATRMKCATLSMVVIKHGILAHEGATVPKTTTEDIPGEGA